MASETILLVLIVRNAGLRSTLVARLSMAGADVLTAEDFDDPRLARHTRRPVVLVADDAAVAQWEGGVAGLTADPRWIRLVLISSEPAAPGDDPRLIRLESGIAAKAIMELVPQWCAQQG